MKLYRYIITAAASVLAIASCQKSEVAEYQWGPKDTEGTKTEVYFTALNEANVELTSEDNTFTVQLGRDVTTEALTVPVKVVFNQFGAFTVPENVTFAAGDATADLVIDISKVEAAKETRLEIAIPEDYYYLYKDYTTANVSHNYTVSIVKVTWETVATGTYQSWYFGDIPNVKLQNCKDVPTRFRFVDLIAPGYNIEFVLTGKEQESTDPSATYDGVTGKFYNATMAAQLVGYSHPTYGPMHIVDVATQQANTSYLKWNMYFPEAHYMIMYARYGVSAGYFGADDDVFVPDDLN